MEQFNLDKYLENPSRKIVTRDGREAIIVCTNADDKFPVVAKIQGCDNPFVELFNRDGIHSFDWDGCIFDLFFADEEELTNFEKAVQNILNEPHFQDIEAVKQFSKELLDLARKEMMKDAVELHIVESFNPVGTKNEKPHGFTALCDNAEYPDFYPVTGQTIKVIPIKTEQMSKIAEKIHNVALQKAEEYSKTHGNSIIEEVAYGRGYKSGYIKSYEQAMKDFLEKAEKWIEDNFSISEGMSGYQVSNDFKNYMQNEI